ncbi:MAG: polysaccharide deacetylase family protein [Bacteroidales bacterium]|jgi:peptidoglycan/xylan/chitin deacetylase (PgdA/CDA1 family)|nr:polysaccharide deacetylase family protein [Bacteroidales bacterium]
MPQSLFNFSQPQPPKIAERLFFRVVWRLPRAKKTVYLTFDDGPVPHYTEFVLDILKQYAVKATFFCVGENIEKHPEIFKLLKEQGHRVGTHTYNHLKSWRTNFFRYITNVKKAADLAQSKLFRPPHGQITPWAAFLISLRYRVIMWDVLSKDYDTRISAEECFENVKNYVRNGSIIVFHDSQKANNNLRDVLPKVIDYLKSEGYEFATI